MTPDRDPLDAKPTRAPASGRQDLRLLMQGGPLAGLSLELGSRPIVIGRAPSCSLRLNDATIAEQQISITRCAASGELVLDALGKDVETRLNGHTTHHAILKVGDSVEVGDWQMLVAEPPADCHDLDRQDGGVVHRADLSEAGLSASLRMSGVGREQQETLLKIGLAAGDESTSVLLASELRVLAECLSHDHWAWLTWNQGIAKPPATMGDDGEWLAQFDSCDPLIRDSVCRQRGVIQVGSTSSAPGSMLWVPHINSQNCFSGLALYRSGATESFQPSDLSFAALAALRISESLGMSEFAAEASAACPETAVQSTPETQSVDDLTRVVGGFAHDLNNPLSSLIGFLDLAERIMERELQGKPGDKLRHLLRRANNAADFCRALSRNVLSFVRKQPFASPPVDYVLDAVLDHTLDLCDSSLRRARATARLEAPQELEMFGDRTAVQQILMNLVNNAAEAIGDAAVVDGEVAIEVTIVGEQVQICVRDNGPGIPEELQSRVMEPLFSTKGESKGTGLGLHVVSELATRNGGTLRLDSRPGEGACFTVTLPRVASAATFKSEHESEIVL